MSNGLLALVVLLALAVGWGAWVFNRLVGGRARVNNAFARIDGQLKHRHDLVPTLVSTALAYLQHERQTLKGVTLARQRASDARQALAGSFGGPPSRSVPDHASGGISSRTPGGISSRTPGGISSRTPGRIPSSTPRVIPGSAPGALSSGSPSAAARDASHGTSDDASSRSSGRASRRAWGRAEGGAGARASTPELLEALDRAEAALNTALGRFAMVVEAYPELKADPALTQLDAELHATEQRIGLARQVFNDAVTSYNHVLGRFPTSLVANACGFTAAGRLRSNAKKTGRRAPVMLHLP